MRNTAAAFQSSATKPYPPPCENPISTLMSMSHQICSLSLIPILSQSHCQILQAPLRRRRKQSILIRCRHTLSPAFDSEFENCRLTERETCYSTTESLSDILYSSVPLHGHRYRTSKCFTRYSVGCQSKTTAHMGSAIVHFAGSALQNRHPSHLTSENQQFNNDH